MNILSTQLALYAVLMGGYAIAMQQQSVRSTGPTRTSTMPFVAEKQPAEFGKVFRSEEAEKNVENSSSGTLQLPNKLFAAYAPLAEQVKRMGPKPHHEVTIRKLVELQFKQGTPAQKDTVAKMLYEDLQKSPLERCECDDAPLKKRIELILDIMMRMQSRDKKEPLVYTSLDSQQLLQDFWAIRALQADNFKNITVNLIYTAFDPNYAHHAPAEKTYHDLMSGVEELSNRTGLKINQFDLTKKVVPGQINIFSNSYDYFIRAHLENPSLKSSIMTLVDPMSLQEVGISQEPTMLALYRELEEDDDRFADILVSFLRREGPRVYMRDDAELSIAELEERLSQLSEQDTNPATLRALLEQEFQDLSIIPMSNPLLTFRSMIDLALADQGVAYIIADQLEPITHKDIRVIVREKYDQKAFNEEIEKAEESYLQEEGYIVLC